MELSERLKAVASFVTPGSRIADVGCDHGYIPIYLYEKGSIKKAIAMDINEGPLQRAKEHIAEHNLSCYIETRLSDGVENLKHGEADTLIIAGMGGPLMQKILTDGVETIKGMKEFILQPQSEIREFRHFLLENGFRIVEETIICEEDKFYPIMKVVFGTDSYEKEIEYAYGKLLIANRNKVLLDFLEKEKSIKTNIYKNLYKAKEPSVFALTRMKELRQELDEIEQALMEI
ncbi:MAG: class I SAM-dependent methyltransferase [Lachnospiraceae bacterium]|nr:class I SAM-dependent methyltransferase [Lachnospiraceae bacterium]